MERPKLNGLKIKRLPDCPAGAQPVLPKALSTLSTWPQGSWHSYLHPAKTLSPCSDPVEKQLTLWSSHSSSPGDGLELHCLMKICHTEKERMQHPFLDRPRVHRAINISCKKDIVAWKAVQHPASIATNIILLCHFTLYLLMKIACFHKQKYFNSTALNAALFH